MVAPTDTSVEVVKHTLGGPSIDETQMVDEVPNAMTFFLDDDHPQQPNEVPGGILVFKEVPGEMEGSKAVTEFTEDSLPLQFH